LIERSRIALGSCLRWWAVLGSNQNGSRVPANQRYASGLSNYNKD
jgi:hypothetical protein